MLVKDIFALATKIGIEADPRGSSGVKKMMDRIKKDYGKMTTEEKEYFDAERLTNPYPDCRIHFDNGKPVKRVMSGIDIGSSEILLASQLNERGKKIDAVIAHHPHGRALAELHKVMDMSVEVFEEMGVPVHIAEKISDERVREVGRSTHAINHYQTIGVAELLGISFLNTHTTTDNLVNEFIIDYIKSRKPQIVGDILDILLEIPEYKAAKKMGFGPKIIAGDARHRVGKILVEMTGGTNPSNKVYKEFSSYGISTLVGMHMREEAVQKATEHHMNIVIAGHISSDSLGMNLFLDELEKKGIEVVACGGLIRVSRLKKK